MFVFNFNLVKLYKSAWTGRPLTGNTVKPALPPNQVLIQTKSGVLEFELVAEADN